MWKAIGFKLLCQILLHSLNDLMSSVAVLLFICAVSALASAHFISLFTRVVREGYKRWSTDVG
ncbi:MAG: hypothetical protein RLZZ87_490 [Actinomycetota bacterium]|jgi:hypothetical protein